MFEHGRVTHGPESGVRQALHHGDIAFIKGERVAGENFEHAYNFALVLNGPGNHGTNAQKLASGGVHSRIGFGIVAAQGFAGTDAFTGKAGVNLKLAAERWRARTDA